MYRPTNSSVRTHTEAQAQAHAQPECFTMNKCIGPKEASAPHSECEHKWAAPGRCGRSCRWAASGRCESSHRWARSLVQGASLGGLPQSTPQGASRISYPFLWGKALLALHLTALITAPSRPRPWPSGFAPSDHIGIISVFCTTSLSLFCCRVTVGQQQM